MRIAGAPTGIAKKVTGLLIVLFVLVFLAALALSALFAAGAEAKTIDPGLDSPAVKNAEQIRRLSEPFVIAALPDTQGYARDGELGFAKQIEWVLANAKEENIVFLTHLGDVVDSGTDDGQWANAMDALDPLLRQNWLPFSIVRGNHDDPGYFLDHLPLSLTGEKPWFVAASPSGLCQAQKFSVQGAWFLHIGFQMEPTQAELQWADYLLKRPQLQGMPVIVSTHDYLFPGGRSATGWAMWDEFVYGNPMVFMVLNGHTHTEYAVVDRDAANQPVYQMLSDYQDRAFGGNGLMRLITIDPVGNTIEVKTFSPYYQTEAADENGDEVVMVDANYFETDADSQFEFSSRTGYAVNIKERLVSDVLGEAGNDRNTANLDNSEEMMPTSDPGGNGSPGPSMPSFEDVTAHAQRWSELGSVVALLIVTGGHDTAGLGGPGFRILDGKGVFIPS